MKKILSFLLAAILFCGLLLTACGKKEPPLDEEKLELVLTDWMRYISSQEAMYEDLDWAISYIEAFSEQPDWNTLQSARAAVELAAKRIELRDEPAWDAPEEAYRYFMDRGIDVSFIQPELSGFESGRQSMLLTCKTLRENLVNTVFMRDGISRIMDTMAFYEQEHQLSLTYLAINTDYLLLNLNSAEWTEKVYKSMQEASPRIYAARDPGLATAEALEEAAAETMEAYSAILSDRALLVGREQADLDLILAYIERGDTASLLSMYGTIEGLPALLPDPGWDLEEAYYFWDNEDGTRRYLTKKEDLTGPPEHCILEFSDVTEDEVVEYIAYLYEVLGLSGRWVDGENGDYNVYFQCGDSVLAVSWEEKGAAIYMLEDPVCLAPDWFIEANQA